MIRQFRLCAYYFRLGIADTYRAVLTLVSNICIVAGICLPALLLLGFESGLVQQLRNDILKSATAREVRIWVTRENNTLTESREAKLESIPGISLVIPDINRAAELGRGGNSIEANLNSTKPGDPFLNFYGADVLKAGERGIVISTHVADELGVAYDSVDEKRFAAEGNPSIEIKLQRFEATKIGRYSIEVPVRGVFRTGEAEQALGFLDRQMMDWLEDFTVGRSVKELDLPGSLQPPTPKFDGYLSYTKLAYDDDDLQRLRRRGFTAVAIEDAGLDDADRWRSLYGLLWPHNLKVYWIHSQLADELGQTTVQTPSRDIEDITSSDDVVMPWTAPQTIKLDGQPHRVVGVTMRGRWLRSYFRSYETRITRKDEMLTHVVLMQANDTGESSRLFVDNKNELELTPRFAARLDHKRATKLFEGGLLVADHVTRSVVDVVTPLIQFKPSWRDHVDGFCENWAEQVRQSSAYQTLARWESAYDQADELPIAVVSADLAAHLAGAKAGRLEFDDSQNSFVPRHFENVYHAGRVYTDTLDEVPSVDGSLRELGYTTASAQTRVLEMKSYASTLNMLVTVVLSAVLLFGGITVAFVFSEVTSRKRGAIGVMRIMGMPQWGVFWVVFVRAIVVGLLGGLVSVGVGLGGAHVLTDIFGARCEIQFAHFVYIFIGALACCLVGVILPALHATRIDPIIAIADSRIQ